MFKNLILSLLFIALSLSAKPRVVAYSYGTLSSSNDIDYSKITHIVGSFVNSDSLGNLSFQTWTPESEIINVLKKAKLSGVVPMIALGTTVGGWQMTKSKSTRSNFISNLLAFCDTNGIKGIDLDLEGTAAKFNWGNPGTFFPEPYESLAVELRAAMPDSMLLTAAIGSYSNTGAQWTDKFLNALDWVNVMIYDRALSWEGSEVVNHSTYQGHLDAANYWYSNRGLAKDKIVLGVPFYARGWDRDNDRIYRENPGWDVTTWDYKDFITRESIPSNQDTLNFSADESIKYPRADSITGKGTLFFNSFDMIAKKTDWTIANNYSGIMIWHLSADLPTTNDKSLLRAIDSVIAQSSSILKPNSFKTINLIKASFVKNKIVLSGLRENMQYQFSLYSANGKIVYQNDFKTLNSTAKISISSKLFAKGVYLFSLENSIEDSYNSFILW